MPVPANLTNDQIVHDVICKRFMFSLDEIEDILAGILDPTTIKHNEIFRFVVNLPCIKPKDLGPAPEDQNCFVCLNKYGRGDHFDTDTPAKLPCGHILGADCLMYWLKDHESCPLCRRTVFARPVASGHLNDPKLEQLARNFLFYAKTYLLTLRHRRYRDKKHSLSGLILDPSLDDSYRGFINWAQGFGPVDGGWNRYRYGWSGYTLWTRYDDFRIFCRSQALSLIVRMREEFETDWAP